VLLALLIALQPAVAVAMSSSKTYQEHPAAQVSPPQEAAGPDLSSDAPKHFEAPAAPQAGETTFTFDPAARKAKFRVDDGWDLDQYLFADASPLDFYIDLKGFQPSDPARITLQVYDVDQAGAAGGLAGEHGNSATSTKSIAGRQAPTQPGSRG